MEREFYTDEFEQLIKEKSDQFRMYPSKRVWHSIYNNLHPSRRWPSFAISVLFFTSLVSIGYLNTSDNIKNIKFTGSKASAVTLADNSVINNSSSVQNNISAKTGNISNTNSHSVTRSETPGDINLSDKDQVDDVISAVSKKKPFISASAVKDKSIHILKPAEDQVNNNQLLVGNTGAKKTSNKIKATKSAVVNGSSSIVDIEENDEVVSNGGSKAGILTASPESQTVVSDDQKPDIEKESKILPTIRSASETKTDAQEEKSWIENYAQQNKPARSGWKDRLDVELYATPAVNYRKLTTESKGSAAPFATTGDINRSISQKPGLGIETGLGLSYAFAKNLRLKAGLQFNYTNYNINADQINHPIQTSILLTDPVTGYSYPAARVSSIANAYDNNAQQPVTLHNRTYQVSIPVGLAYKLSSNKKVEWFAGATVQPSYIFGGKAHLISSDLKNYVSDPSTIRNWNLNIGIETYMNYKFGTYSLRVGPQVRYQVYSTYRKDVALIEKPYAVGFKIGILKGF